MDSQRKSINNGPQTPSGKKGNPPETEFLDGKESDKPGSDQKKAQKNALSSRSKAKNKSGAKGEVIKPVVSVTKKVKEGLPKKKNLGPSGQEWDI